MTSRFQELLDELVTLHRTMREVPPDSATKTHGIVSVPGSAWDIVCQDRDEWKRRALKAEAENARLLSERTKLLDTLSVTVTCLECVYERVDDWNVAHAIDPFAVKDHVAVAKSVIREALDKKP
jgi:hypothetical protein